MPHSSLFRFVPATDKLLRYFSPEEISHLKLRNEQCALLASLPRPLLRDLVNTFLDRLREEIKAGALTDRQELEVPVLLSRLANFLLVQGQPHFRRVLNATGVVIHTNLGRSLLADQAVAAVQEACRNYCNLEFNLETGERGSRYSHVEDLLCKLAGTEAALVVNNNAAAVLITLDTFGKGKEVIVSRGELVEIGGSFRIPEVMEKSGCVLREVGATNRTHLRDYQSALNERTGALMKVHSSNYRIIGFTSAPAREEIVRLAHEHGLPALEDLGSGSLCSFAGLGISEIFSEPTIQQVAASGMDVVTCSGDKVLGGPQAGIIVGKKEYIDKIKSNPLNRALRIDKMTLAALEATLRLYTDPDLARKHVPTLRMIFSSLDVIRGRAKKLQRLLAKDPVLKEKTTLIPGVSRIGGGSFPECDLPTCLVALHTEAPDTLKMHLLTASPPLIGRIEHNAFCLDPRTLRDDELPLVARSLHEGILHTQ